MFRLSVPVSWLALASLILYFADVGHGFRILEPGTTTPQGEYFKPYEKGFVGIYGDPTNLQRERINEGAFETSDSELLYEGVSPRQSCPNMVGPFSDGNYYCSAREYGYCDRRSGTCFCNAGYFGIDCSQCSDSHFRYNNGDHCFPKKLCPNDCSGSGECNFATGMCSCLEHRTGTSCETLLCTKHSSLCDTCTNDECLKCASGYFLTGNKSEVCKTCYVFDPRCAGCTLEEGCTVCADSTLTSVRRSGYRLSDPLLAPEETSREFGITLPFGTKSPESFADAESYIVSNTPDNLLKDKAVSCAQGLHDDATILCTPTTTSHMVCGHYGVFTFAYPNYQVKETDKSLRMQVRRTGGGYGEVDINYYIKHFTTNDSDVIATAPYTTVQRLRFEDGTVEISFLITILDDNIVEENEVFQVVLEVPEGGGSVGAQFRTNVTIVDDDLPLLSPKLSKSQENTTIARAGQGFTTTINAFAATGHALPGTNERFFALIENNLQQWQSPGSVTGQRNALRHVCTVTSAGGNVYQVSSAGVKEQGGYQMRIWHAFPRSIRGEYYYDGFFERLAVERLDHQVNFTWGTGNLIPRGSDYISIRWSGAILPAATGLHRFKVNADDHARLWINGELLLDHWHERDVNLEPSRSIALTKDVLVEVVMEYREVRGDAYAVLMWAPPSADLTVVPQENLYSLFEIDRSPVQVTIQSADTDASTTESTGDGLYGAVALRESSFTVCPRDQFRNMRDDDDAFYLSSQLFSAELLLGDDHGHHGVGAERVTPVMSYNPDTHCFDFVYTPERAGDYTLSIYYEPTRGAGRVAISGSPFLLTVEPDKMSGPKSLIRDLPSTLYAEAGHCYNYTVTARDNAENYIFEGGAGIQAYMYRVDYYTRTNGTLEALPTMAPTSAPALTFAPSMPSLSPSFRPTSAPTSGPSVLFSDTASFTSPDSDTGYDVVRNGIVLDRGDGNYTVQFCPVIAGVYEIHTMLDSRGVSNQPYSVLSRYHSSQLPTGRGSYTGQYIGDGPSKSVVSHTVASGYTTTVEAIGSGSAVVGVASSFLVTVRDPYGNVMRTDSPSVDVTAKLDLSPNATVGVYSYQNGSYLVTYTPKVAGDNTLSIYVGGALVHAAPVTIPTTGGASASTYSFAVGPGLYSGTAGDASYIQVYSFDGDGNRLTTYDDQYVFEVNGTNVLTGALQPCPSPPVVNHPICDIDDALGGHYWGTFTPTISGPNTVSVFLVEPGSSRRRLAAGDKKQLGSPFPAVIVPSAPKAESTDISGVLYDNVAGVTAQIDLRLRDYFRNLLISGGRNIELALLGVGIDWGTPQPLPLYQGLPNRPYYRGFYAGYPTWYGSLSDHLDGSYSLTYSVPVAGDYVLRLALGESGLNASYFNGTDFGVLFAQNFNERPFELATQGRDVNLHTSLSWTGDIGRLASTQGDLGSGTYLNRYTTRMEQNISVDLRNIDMTEYMKSANTVYKFRDEYWSAIWTGMITPEVAEVHTFTAEIDSGSTVSVRIGGRGLEFNNTSPGVVVLNITGDSAETTGRYNFTDTRYREFEVRFVHYTGDAVLKFYWESPTTARRTIPTTAFTHWRNISHFNTTIHPAPLCSHCSTAYGAALSDAQVAVKKSFWVYARDSFSNLMQVGGHEPTMVAVGKDGVAFRGDVTDYGNSTYLVEYYPTQAGEFRMYVSIGCCAPHPNIGLAAELQELSPLLIQGAPFLLTVTPAPVDQSRTVAVGRGLIGGTAGEVLSFSTLYRDIHNNPTTAKDPADTQFVIMFKDQVTSDVVVPTSLSTEHGASNSTTTYLLTRAGKYLMYVFLKADTVGRASTQIIASPFQITIAPAKADPALTVCRGVGLRQASAGGNRSTSFEVQLYDSYHNNLITGGNRLYVRLQGDAAFLQPRQDVIPACQDTQNGRSVCTYAPVYRGVHQLTIRLLNNVITHPGGLGLTASYYTSTDGAMDQHEAATFTRIDESVQFTWPTGDIIPSTVLAVGRSIPLGRAGQSVRWNGYLVSPRSDLFHIVTRASNLNASVYLDDVLIFDTAVGIDEPVSLVVDAAYHLRVVASSANNNPAGGGSFRAIELRWSTPTVNEYAIPRFFLYDSASDVALSPFPVTVAP